MVRNGLTRFIGRIAFAGEPNHLGNGQPESVSIMPSDPAERARAGLHDRFGSTKGNEILTGTTGIVLLGLLIAEGVTIVSIGGLADVHMFVGLALVPPVLLKLATTGYRAWRYYARSSPYRAMGPPLLPLRLMAPLFVALTLAVLVTGVLLMAQGNKGGSLLEIHKVCFIAWVVLFGVHVLAYLPRSVRLTLGDWHLSRSAALPGVGARNVLLIAAVGGGVAVAVSLLPTIDHWHP